MKKIILAALSMVSIHAFAYQPGMSQMDAIDLGRKGPTTDVTDAKKNTGGDDRSREILTIKVVDANGPISDAKCAISNDKGDWKVSAPDTVKVQRSAGDLKLQCTKDGYAPQSMTLQASTIQITPKHFRFEGDSDEDGDDDQVTVPYYNANITVQMTASGQQASN